MTQQNEFQKILAKPGQRALAEIGVLNFEQLSKFTEAEIMQLHGMGKSGLNRLKSSLEEKGLTFAQKK